MVPLLSGVVTKAGLTPAAEGAGAIALGPLAGFVALLEVEVEVPLPPPLAVMAAAADFFGVFAART
jgi:hypothetical protein